MQHFDVLQELVFLLSSPRRQLSKSSGDISASLLVAEYPKAHVRSRLNAIQHLADRADRFIEAAVLLLSIEKPRYAVHGFLGIIGTTHAAGAIQDQHDGAF